jgi:nitrite reductase/ring-hydroxylating ferredoxin subunit
MDAHCFHMGTPLVGGDIEDVDGAACVVCPAHRYRIDISTGRKVDRDLCGKTCSSADQKQRLYRVHCDDEFIWVDLPLPNEPLAPLPSDYYNQVAAASPTAAGAQQAQQPFGAAPAPAGRGLAGAGSGLAAPLQPYAGVSQWPVGPSGVTAAAPMDASRAGPAVPVAEPPLELSQASQASQQAQQGPAPGAPPSSLMSFYPAARPDPPHIARRKAATAAILARSYRPPTVDAPMQASPVKLAAPAVAAPAPPVVPVRATSGSAAGARQATLFESWSRGPAVGATSGAEGMDMN